MERFKGLGASYEVTFAKSHPLQAAPPTAPAITADGVPIELGACVDGLPDITRALAFGAGAIGLLSTDALYLDRPDLPDEEEQYQDAIGVIQALGGRTATFLTLDLASDKLPRPARRPAGANPALGMRSIRLSLARRDIFRTQLRALYRASAAGPLRILFPLVSGVTEMAEARSVCDEVCRELCEQELPHDRHTPIGCMIETPSAALTADHLARQSSFFNVGTNHLIQCCFGADRDNQDVAYLYQPLHPAVLRSLKLVADAARSAGRPVAISGDMAGDPAFVWILLGLGFRELVVTPRHVPIIKSVIRASSLAEAERLTAVALALGSEVEIEQLVLGAMGELFGPDLFGSELGLPVDFRFGDKDSNLDSQIQSLASCH